MDRGTVLQALSGMEQYVVRLRQQDDETKRQVNTLQASIATAKQELDRMQHLERDQHIDEAGRLSAAADAARCRSNISQMEQALREREKQAVEFQSQIQTAQHLADELKTAEGYMHDYEQRAQRWVNEAYNMMR